MLTENLLQSLIQYLPTPDQLNKLQEYSAEYNDLAEAEQFAISLADIKRLVPRLKSLKFQLHYPELVQDCKPDIVAATEACQEVSVVAHYSDHDDHFHHSHCHCRFAGPTSSGRSSS